MTEQGAARTDNPNKQKQIMAACKFGTMLVCLFFARTGLASDPLDTWTWRNPLPTANDLQAIAYGDGHFVAVSEGTILISTDGINWTQHLSGTQARLRAITYGNGRFVAVGGETWFLGSSEPSAIIVTSTDATNWVQSEVAGQGPLSGVAYGNGKFVAVSEGGSVLTSVDALNWDVTEPAPQFSVLNAVAYGNGQFVVVGRNSGLVLVSRDGVNWVQTYSGAAAEFLTAVTYGDGRFIAVGYVNYTNPLVLSSTNGMHWVHRESGIQGPTFLSGIAFGNGVFVITTVDNGDSLLLTSPDGESWSQFRPERSSYLHGISYGEGQFVAVGSGGTIMTSTDGMTWIPRQRGTIGSLSAITYGDGLFVAVGSPDGDSTILTSTNGVSWTQRLSGVSPGINPWFVGVAYGNGQFVVAGEGWTTNAAGWAGTNIIVTSADGVNWVQQDATNEWPAAVSYGNGQFVAVGIYGGISTSTNGAKWIQRDSGLAREVQTALSGIAYGDGQFVAVGHSWEPTITNHSGIFKPMILTSDGATYKVWVDVQLSDFVSTVILTSTDGVIWTEQQSGTERDSLRSVAYGNGQFVCVGWSGLILTSPDGVNWVKHQSGAQSGLLNAIAYGNGYFVTVGWQGTILQSGSIITLALAPKLSSDRLALSLEGPTGHTYTIQSSRDLTSWRNLTNITTTQPLTVILDALPAGSERSFYRAYSP
jgi:hypothetical protein